MMSRQGMAAAPWIGAPGFAHGAQNRQTSQPVQVACRAPRMRPRLSIRRSSRRPTTASRGCSGYDLPMKPLEPAVIGIRNNRHRFSKPVAASRRRCQPKRVDPNPLKSPCLHEPDSRQSRSFLPRSQAVDRFDFARAVVGQSCHGPRIFNAFAGGSPRN